MTDKIRSGFKKLEEWIESHDYKAYEPFDGLLSYLTPLTFNSQFAKRLLIQLVRQSPVNLRPLLGIPPATATKGMGYMAWGYLTRLRHCDGNGDGDAYRTKARKCLQWLEENRSPRAEEFAWGNHFEWVSRGGHLPKDEPTIVWSSLIGHAFLDAYEQLEEDRYLEVVRSISRWILKLPRVNTSTGSCLGYTAQGPSSVHNASMLGAGFLARARKVIDDDQMMEAAHKAMEFSCVRQLPDGSWRYAEDSNHSWIDNFHTGYNLDSLKFYLEAGGDERYRENLVSGFTYFKNTFFNEEGRPAYYSTRAYPIDIQCASQAITTLSGFRDHDPEAGELARRVAEWTIDNMQSRDGFFIYRLYPWGRSKVPMFHWGQATMYKALSHLA